MNFEYVTKPEVKVIYIEILITYFTLEIQIW